MRMLRKLILQNINLLLKFVNALSISLQILIQLQYQAISAFRFLSMLDQIQFDFLDLQNELLIDILDAILSDFNQFVDLIHRFIILTLLIAEDFILICFALDALDHFFNLVYFLHDFLYLQGFGDFVEVLQDLLDLLVLGVHLFIEHAY